VSVDTVRPPKKTELKKRVAGVVVSSRQPVVAVAPCPDSSKPVVLWLRGEWWRSAVKNANAVVCEESFGPSPKTIAQMGQRRGYLEALCEVEDKPFATVNTSEWRTVVGSALNVAFPRDSKLAKALSKKLVHELYAIAVTDDEADAVLIGLWAYLTRTWDDPSFSLPVRTPNV